MDNDDRPKIDDNLEIVIYSKDEQHKHRTYYYSVKELKGYITEEILFQLKCSTDFNKTILEINENLLASLKSNIDIINKIKEILGDK